MTQIFLFLIIKCKISTNIFRLINELYALLIKSRYKTNWTNV